MAERPTPDALRDRLAGLAARRGFLLPHHGALAAGAPVLHAAYLAMYDALTVAERILSPLERESVWLCLLVAAREGIGTHHLGLFRAAGGSDTEAEALVTLAGAAQTHDSLCFAAAHWPDHLPALDPAEAWGRTVDALRDPVPATLADLCLLTVQAALGKPEGVAEQLRRLYAAGVDEAAMVEALSYVMWPCGVNTFLEACDVWHGLMRAGVVTPSPLFAAWRDMEGLGAWAPGAAVGGFADRDKGDGDG